MKKAFNILTKAREFRAVSGENQSQFWSRFGVTQSGGSRYESGLDIPLPTAMLMVLYQQGIITDAQLKLAEKASIKAGVVR